MTPADFQRDPYLRTSGYNLAVWGPLNVLFSFPAYSYALGVPWRGSAAFAYGSVLVFVGMVLMMFNERRATKLMGPPSSESVFEIVNLWAGALLLAVVVTSACELVGRSSYVLPVWMISIGAVYAVWGWHTITEMRWFGAVLFVVGSASVVAQLGAPDIRPGMLGLHLWNLTMGAGFVAASVLINRRYAWRVPGAQE